jgi:hypothetical protein
MTDLAEGQAAAMTYRELMQRLKAAKNTPEYIVVELDAMAAARNGSITTQESDQLVAESRQMRKGLKESDGQAAMTENGEAVSEQAAHVIPF